MKSNTMNKKLAIIDVDGTLVKGQTQQLLIKYLFKHKLISFSFFIRLNVWFVFYKLGFITDIRKALSFALGYFKGRKINDIEPVMDTFIQKAVEPFIYPKSFELIKDLREKGYYILLLSGAIEPIISRLAKIFAADNYLCTKIDIKDGEYTGMLAHEIVYGENKVDVLQQFIKVHGFDIKEAAAYADHLSDVALLSTVGHPFAVNPSTALKTYAVEHNIPVLYL